MERCNDCGTKISIINREPGEIIECPECGMDHELNGQKLSIMHIGLSEE